MVAQFSRSSSKKLHDNAHPLASALFIFRKKESELTSHVLQHTWVISRDLKWRSTQRGSVYYATGDDDLLVDFVITSGNKRAFAHVEHSHPPPVPHSVHEQRIGIDSWQGRHPRQITRRGMIAHGKVRRRMNHNRQVPGTGKTWRVRGQVVQTWGKLGNQGIANWSM